jgi:hypothetical protein
VDSVTVEVFFDIVGASVLEVGSAVLVDFSKVVDVGSTVDVVGFKVVEVGLEVVDVISKVGDGF